MSFMINGAETPEQARARRSKAVMGALEQGAMSQPTDVGSGLSAVGSALAYRAMQSRQPQTANPAAPVAPGADPWAGMRRSPGMLSGLKGLFGLGA